MAELHVLTAYFAAWIVVTDVLNVRLGVELMSCSVVVAAVISRQLRLFVRDWWLLIAGMLMWNVSGPIARLSPVPPHLDFMLTMDRWLFFGHQPAALVQQALSYPGHLTVLDWSTAAVYSLHVPEPYIAAYFLWRMDRARYFRFVSASLLLLVLGFLTFITFPAIPPWMASKMGRLPDVYNGYGPVIHGHPLSFHGTPIFYLFGFVGDAVAAFPSEHAAFPLLETLAFWRIVGPRVRAGLLGYVTLVLFTVLYLGEHWVTDALAGYAFALVLWAAVCAYCSRSLPSGIVPVSWSRGFREGQT
ncbi:MAG: hypothetical protein NVSMB52_19370 [Chloroflexota bacterium]